MTAKEFWRHKFDEYPQTDSEKLAVAMMTEYLESQASDKDKEMLGLVQDIERIGNESLIFEMDLKDAKQEIERLKGLIEKMYWKLFQHHLAEPDNFQLFKTENNL